MKPEQNMALQGLSLKEKLERLKKWHEAGQVTEEQLRYFSNRWIKKSHKCSKEQNFGPYQTVFEIEVQKLINKLLPRIRESVIKRNEQRVALTTKTLEQIGEILSNYRSYVVVDKLVVISMRYPDKRLNEMAVEYVKKWRMESFSFWALLWSDENLVPMDAVRLMTEDGKVKKCFTKETLLRLLPLIKKQRDKEIQLLEWAIVAGFKDSTAHRNRRLEAFNQLIAAIKI